MSSAPFKGLSQDELRKRLYQTFKNRGVLDLLKTQLRNQLIHELMNPILSGEIKPQAISNGCSSLLISASNSLVADHLHRCGYEYTLSVFYPESGLERDKVLKMEDLLQLIRINPNTDLYKALISGSQKDNAKGFLTQILTELIEHSLYKESCNKEIQTNSTYCKESLVEKLQLIDEQFADMHPHKYEPFQMKLAEYRREIEQQLQEEMFQKLQHFKEVEVAKIKTDERAQAQKEISELRRDLERAHQAKLEALTSRERNAIERLQKQQEIDAKEIYLQRQTLLKDIETVRAREVDLKQRIEAFELTQKLQESKNKTVEDALHRRELAVKNIEETYDQKLKNELLMYQLELKEEYIARAKKVTEDEKKNKEKAKLLQEENISLNSKKQEFNLAVSRAKELELEVESVKAQVLLSSKQNQLLMEKLEKVADYTALKEEKMKFQVQTQLLKQQLEEAQSENLQLREKLNQPSAEYVVLQAELKRAEHARKLEQEAFEAQMKHVEKKFQNEVDCCIELKSKLSECENTIRKLNAQVEDLKLQLKQTQTALENEVYRNPKPSLVDRSVIDLIGNKIVPHDIYTDGAFLKTLYVANDIGLGNATNPNYRQHPIVKSVASPDSDLEFVVDTKARIKELEKEAEYLEQAYRNYQNRVVQSADGLSKPPSSHLPNNLIVSSGQKLRFAEDEQYSQRFAFSCQSKSYKWTPENGDCLKGHVTPPHKKRASASRRLSSTPVPKAKKNISNKLFSEDAVDPALSVSQQTMDQPLSPILRTGNLSSIESASNTSAASSSSPSEQKLSLNQEQGDNQNINGSTYLEKVIYKGITNSDFAERDQGDIPEQLRSDGSHPSGNVVNNSHFPTTLPAASMSQQDINETELEDLKVQKSSKEQQEAEEMQKWEEDEEQRERQEALQMKSEIEIPIEKLCFQKSTEASEEKQEVKTSETSTPKSEEHAVEANPNPLEKYMKIIQQNRQQEIANEESKKQETEASSEKFLGSEKEDSFSAAGIGEPDEDFW